MKKKFTFFCLSILAIVIMPISLKAQSGSCPGYTAYHDPENGPVALSSTYPPYVSASPSANTIPGVGYCTSDQHFYSFNSCTAASSTSGPLYTYTFSFPTTTSVYGSCSIFPVGMLSMPPGIPAEAKQILPRPTAASPIRSRA